MYFLIKDLSTINSMYQFSLGAFLTLFRAALAQVGGGGEGGEEQFGCRG